MAETKNRRRQRVPKPSPAPALTVEDRTRIAGDVVALLERHYGVTPSMLSGWKDLVAFGWLWLIATGGLAFVLGMVCQQQLTLHGF